MLPFQHVVLFSTEDKPLVECSFITEFEDHIFVTVDADAFFFLHDLITSYLKEKDKVLGTITSARPTSPNPHPPAPSPSPTPSSQSNLKPGRSSTSSNSSTLDLSSSQSIANGSAVNINEAGTSSKNGTEEKPANTKHVNIKVEKSDVEMLMRTDWRHFNCKTWHLEPTVR